MLIYVDNKAEDPSEDIKYLYASLRKDKGRNVPNAKCTNADFISFESSYTGEDEGIGFLP